MVDDELGEVTMLLGMKLDLNLLNRQVKHLYELNPRGKDDLLEGVINLLEYFLDTAEEQGLWHHPKETENDGEIDGIPIHSSS